jgi:hypothetical protein
MEEEKGRNEERGRQMDRWMKGNKNEEMEKEK